MSKGRTMARGARVAGALLLAGLVALDLGWIVRDFLRATEVTDVWWMWSGLLFRAQDGVWVSSFVEPTLLVLYTVGAVTALRSSAAAGILGWTGAVTVLLRVPTLWNLNAGWVLGGVSDGLRLKVLWSAITMVTLGAALVVTAVAGRRPAAESADGDVPVPAPGTDGPAPLRRGTADEAPARPTPGGGRTASLLLGTVAVVLIGWELRSGFDQGWGLYWGHFAGDRALVTLLAVPESWYGWALALLSLAAAFAAFTRAPYSRPLGMTVSAPLLGLGIFSLSFAAKAGLLEHLGELGLYDRLQLATAVFEVLAACTVLAALAPRHAEQTAPLAAGQPTHP